MIGSSTDIQGLAMSFVQADRAAKDNLFAKRGNEYNQTLKAYSNLTTKLNEFKTLLTDLDDSGAIESYAVTQSTDEYATVTADANAATGSYEINVAQKASAHQIALGFSSESDPVGDSGEVYIDLGTESFTIDMSTLGAGANLKDFRDAINSDPNNPGVSASIVRTNGSVQLMVGSEETGAANTVSISTNGDPALADIDAAIAGQTEISQAKDAKIFLGSNQELELTSSSNTFEDVIDGLEITIDKVHTDPTETFSFEVGQDPEATEEKLKEITEAYNGIISEISKQKNGVLSSNSALRTIESQLRRDLGDFDLASAGIEIDRYGKMKVNSTDFKEFLEDNPKGLSNIFSGDTGLIEKMEARVEGYVKGKDSMLVSSKAIVQSRLDSLNDQMLRFDERMENVYNRYVQQFAQMQNTISQMEQTAGMF